MNNTPAPQPAKADTSILDPRNETLQQRVATIIQTGYTDKLTSDAVAEQVMGAVAADAARHVAQETAALRTEIRNTERLWRNACDARDARDALIAQLRENLSRCKGASDDSEYGHTNVCRVVDAALAASPESAAADHVDPKNLHRVICEASGYVHDEKDWRRDLCSLANFVAELRDKVAGMTGTMHSMLAELVEEREQTAELRKAIEYVRGLGEVYVYPNDWRCSKMGGEPPIDAYEKIDLSTVGPDAGPQPEGT